MWFWLNIPLATLFLTATAGIPMRMVIKHPDTAPDCGRGSSPETSSSVLAVGTSDPAPRSTRPFATPRTIP